MSNPIIYKRVQHGSLAYRILNYARFMSRQKDGTFSVEDYRGFRFKTVKPSYIKRSIDSLVRHGHLQKIGNDRYRYTESDVLYEIDRVYKDTLYTKVKSNKRRHPKEREELEDIQSDDF